MNPRCALIVAISAIASNAVEAAGPQKASHLPEVWIGIRSDGRAGSGAKRDPFNGSPETFDALVQAVGANVRIHLGPGTFVTRGIQAKEGWRISGRGKDLTTIKLADGTATGINNATYAVISKYFDHTWLKYFELSDLTLDCNRANQPVYTDGRVGFSLNAYMIAAKSAKITNVRALGTWANPGEGFPCIIMHDGTTNNQDRIEISGVENINPIGYLGAIGALDQTGGTVSGFIKDCIVTDHLGGSAFGASASRNFKIFNNYARNVSVGINFDTYPADNLEIYNNRLEHVTGWGILFNNGSVLKNVKIHDNVINMALGAGPAFLAGQVEASVAIYRNRIAQPNPSSGIIAGSPKLTGRFSHNEIETHGPFETNSVPNLSVFGNCDRSGRPVRPTFSRRRSIRHKKERPEGQ